MLTSTKIVLSQPTVGLAPSGFTRVHVEMLPREVGHLVGYDPRSLVRPPRRKTGKGSQEISPRNVPDFITKMQQEVQRTIDSGRVKDMERYLLNAIQQGALADWGPLLLVTSSQPDLSRMDDQHLVYFDSDADYFVNDGQHRYCALLDFLADYPEYGDRFTQPVTIACLPSEKFQEWAAQEFHDRNYFAVPVRAGKALLTDSRDPVGALARKLYEHPVISAAGGIATERDTLLKNDPRFTTHAVLHRFVRAFLIGRPGLDKGATLDTVTDDQTRKTWEYFNALGLVLPSWRSEDRDQYLTRTSGVLSALAVVGHDLYNHEPPFDSENLARRLREIGSIDWKRTNLDLVGVVGTERDGHVAPASSRQAIDAIVRYLRERTGV